MADRYWRGGTGTWNTSSTTNWSDTSGGTGGFSVPTAADNVIFDQAATYTVTMTGALTCLSITVSAGTVTFATGTTPTLAISGGMSLVAATVWSSTGTITFNSTTAQTITTNGVNINGAITFNGVAGNWSLGSALTTGATLTTTLTNGTITLNGFTLTTGIFSSNNTNTRSIAFGSNNIVLAHTTAATTVLSMANITNFTYTGTGGFTTAMGVTRTFTSGTSSSPGSVLFNGTTQYGQITTAASGPLDLATGAGNWTVECWFLLTNTTSSHAIFWKGGTTGSVNPSYAFWIQAGGTGQWIVGNGAGGGATQNIPGFVAATWYHFALVRNGSVLTAYVNGVAQTPITMTFIMGNTANNLLGIGNSIDGSTRLHAGNISNVRIVKGVAVYTGNFTPPINTLTPSQSSGTNISAITYSQTSLLLNTPNTVDFLLDSSINAYVVTNTGTATAAATTPVTTVNGSVLTPPKLALTSGASIPTFTTGSFFDTLTFTGSTSVPAVTTVYLKSLTLAAAVAYANLTTVMAGTGSVDTATNTTLTNLTVNNVSGTTTLASATTLTATSTFTLTSGTLDLGGFGLACGIFSSTNANTRAIAFGSTNINLTHTTAATTVLSMAILTNFSYTGTGGFTVVAMSATKTFTCGTTGGTSANAPNLTFTTGASIATITTAGFFNKLDYGTTTFTQAASTLNVNSITLSSTGTYTALILNLRASGTVTYNGKTTAAVTLLTGSPTIAGTVTCTTFTVNGGAFDFTSGTINPSTSFVMTSGSFTLNGGTLGAVPTFTHTAGAVTFNASYATTVTGTYTLTAGTLTLGDGVTLSAGIFSSTGAGVRSIAFGSASAGNINLTHTTAATVVLSMAVVTNFTYTGPGGFTVANMGNTRTFTFGTTGGSLSNAVNLTFTTGASIATLTTAGWFKNLDFGTTGFNPGTTTLNIAGNLTLSATGTYATTTITPRATATYIFNGRSLGPFTVNTAGITITLGSAGGCTVFTMTLGAVDFASFAFTCSSTATLNSTGTLLNFGTFACTTFTNNGATLSLTSGAINASTSFVQSSGSVTVGGSATIGATPLFTHTAGTVTFNTSQSLAVTGTYTFTAGTLNIDDNVTLSTGIFSSTNTNSRTINFGLTTSPGYIALTHTTAATVVLNIAIMTGLTVNALGKFPLVGQQYLTQNAGGFVSNTSVTKTFTVGTTGGNSTNAPCLTVLGTGATQLPTFTTAGWFGDLNILGLSTMTIAATTLNVNSYISQGYYYSLNTTSMNLNFVGSGVITAESDTNNTFGILGAVTINHAGTTSMIYAMCAATTVAFTAGTLECRYYANGPFNGYGQFKLTGAFTQTGGSWYGNAVYIASCTTYTINGPTISFDSGSITATTSMVLTSGSFTFNGGTISAIPLFTHTAGTVTIKTNQTVSLAATGTYTFTAGSLILENNGLAAQLNVGIFSSSGTGVRSITFGNTQNGGYPPFINLTHTTAATTVLSMATATGFTWTAAYDVAYGGGYGGFKSDMVNTRTFVFGTTGGSVTNSPNLRIEGASIPTITTSSWFNILDFSAAQTFTLPATSLNLNSIIAGYAYQTISLAGLTANMRGPGFLDGSNTSVGAVVINNGSNVTQVRTNFFAPVYAASPVVCTTLTITAGTLDGGVQSFTGSCTAGVLTTVGSPTLVPGSYIYSNTVGSGPVSYVGTVVSGSSNTWVLNNLALSFASATLSTNCSQFYSPPAGITCSAGVTWTGGSLTNFGSTTALTAGGSSSLLLTCTTFTLNGPTFNHTLQNGGTINPSTSFVLTAGSYTLNGGVLGAVPLFTHTAGTATFNYNYSLTTTGTYTLTAGTLTLADGVTLDTGIFSSTGTGTRAIAFGSSSAGNINLTHTTAATTVLNMATVTGFTYTGPGGFTVADMANTRTLTFGTTGGSTTTAVNLTFTTGASVATLTTASWFNNLDFGTTSFTLGTTTLNINGGLVLSSSGTYTGLTPSFRSNSTLTSNGKTVAALVVNAPTFTLTTNDATSITGALTLTAGALVAPYDITSGSFASAGPYSRSITGSTTTYTITGAGATAWSFASTGSALLNGTSQYLTAPIGSSTFGSGDFTAECWFYRTSAVAGTLVSNATGNADNNYWAFSVSATGTITLGIRDGAAATVSVTGSITTSINTWVHAAVVRQSGVCSLYVNGVFDNSATITKTITARTTLIGSFQYTGFVDYFPGYITNVRTVTGVAVYTGNFTVPTAPLLPTQSSGTNISAITGSQTSLLLSTPSSSFLTDYSNNNFTVTNTGTATANILSPFAVTSPGITFTSFTLSMTAATAKTFAGGGATYPTLNQGGAGALTISGNNSFGDLTATTRPSTITFTISTTQTFTNFTLSGTAGNLVTINSSSAGTQASLSKTSGTVSVGYLSIRDSNATGGANWDAGATSSNVSNNTGWIFGGYVFTAGGDFFAFF